jgi:multidrug efflux pump subunit AcrB
MMGLTMVVGMLTELSIFYLAELQSEHDIGPASLLDAGEARLRPILMSALIAILTLLPLALGIGRGSGLQRPLATAIIFGLSLGALLILILLPMLVMLFSRALAIRPRPKRGQETA